MNKKWTYGFELECGLNLPRNNSEITIKKNLEDKLQDVWKGVVVKSDASVCVSSLFNCEICTPPTEYNDFVNELQSLFSFLKEKYKLRCNSTCGAHIHFCTDKMTMFKLLENASMVNARFCRLQPLLNEFLPHNRRGNYNYAKDNVLDYSKIKNDRYTKLNFMAYKTHGTIEYRGLGGTDNPALIYAFAELFSSLLEHMIEDKYFYQYKNVEDMLSLLNISSGSILELLKMRNKYKKIETLIQEAKNGLKKQV